MTEWRFLTSSGGGSWDPVVIGGLPVWDHDWRFTGEGIKVPDPQYGNMRGPPVYEIGPEESPVRFAAEEVSNGVFGFWIPVD